MCRLDWEHDLRTTWSEARRHGWTRIRQRADWGLAHAFQKFCMADEARELSGTRIARGGAVFLKRHAVERRSLRQSNALVKAFGDQEKRVNFAAKEKCAVQFQSQWRRMPPHFEIFF